MTITIILALLLWAYFGLTRETPSEKAIREYYEDKEEEKL